MSLVDDSKGTSSPVFQVGKNGKKLIDNPNGLRITEADGVSWAIIEPFAVEMDSTYVVFNVNATNTGSNWPVTLSIDLSNPGRTAAQTLFLPPNNGTAGQFLQTAGGVGSNQMVWATPSAPSGSIKVDSTPFVFNTASPIAMFSTAAGEIIEEVILYVDTPFDANPTLTIGISGDTDKYASFTTASFNASLVTFGQANKYVMTPNYTAQGVEALIATYVQGGATQGAGRIVVKYWTPN